MSRHRRRRGPPEGRALGARPRAAAQPRDPPRSRLARARTRGRRDDCVGGRAPARPCIQRALHQPAACAARRTPRPRADPAARRDLARNRSVAKAPLPRHRAAAAARRRGDPRVGAAPGRGARVLEPARDPGARSKARVSLPAVAAAVLVKRARGAKRSTRARHSGPSASSRAGKARRGSANTASGSLPRIRRRSS